MGCAADGGAGVDCHDAAAKAAGTGLGLTTGAEHLHRPAIPAGADLNLLGGDDLLRVGVRRSNADDACEAHEG